jgi:putative PIN family toxin of toxin-antitoxin system
MRTVLDTSALISALRSGTGAAAEALRLALLGELTILMDYKLACEYRDVALRAEQLRASDKSREQTTSILDALEAIAEPVFVGFQHRPLSADANDDMILDVAINGNAEAIVTYNTKHFRQAAKRFELAVWTPAELLNKLRMRR